MQNLFTLNNLYADYAVGLLGRKEFEGSIFKAIQENMYRFGFPGWNKEDTDDYLSSLYPRISRAINAYQETGSSFETYIGSMVRLTAKEFRSRQVRSYLEENAAWIAQIPDMYVFENELEYNEHNIQETEDQLKLKNPRQLLILILKCCNHISEDFLEKIAPRLGMEPEALNRMINHLRDVRKKREEEMIRMRERINRQFYRCIFLEKKLKVMAKDSIAAQRLMKQLELGRNRLDKTRKRLAQTRQDPSNSQIGKLLGISKGTVDAVLYNLKIRDTPYPQSDQENTE